MNISKPIIDLNILADVAQKLLQSVREADVEYQADSVVSAFNKLNKKSGAVKAYADDPEYRRKTDQKIKNNDLSHIYQEVTSLIKPMALAHPLQEVLNGALQDGIISEQSIQDTKPNGLAYEIVKDGDPEILNANAAVLIADILKIYRRELVIGHEEFPEDITKARMHATTRIVDGFINMLAAKSPKRDPKLEP